MIERRKEPRTRLSLPVTVSGRDADGERFTANVEATSLSRSGALLRGIEAELRCGDVLKVEYEGHKADFPIVWVLNLGDRRSAKVAVHKPSHTPCPWEGALPAAPALATSHGR
jgi:hypothetical protein